MLNYLKAFKELEYKRKKDIKKEEFIYVKNIISKNLYSDYLISNRTNWILETLILKDKIDEFENCKNVVFIGSGSNPYSLIDLSYNYPNINIIGLEYDSYCVKISKFIIEKCGIKNIEIVNINGVDFNFSTLDITDYIFLSVDIDSLDKIYKKVLNTSRAQIYICAPGKYLWNKSILKSF